MPKTSEKGLKLDTGDIIHRTLLLCASQQANA
jgi:hypothetical protein